MKKENKTRFIAVKKYCSAHGEKFNEFICVVLAVIVALICSNALVNIQNDDDLLACK